MSNFNKCLEIVLHHEGGYVNHPKDPGGMTNMGVTKRVYEEWVGYSVSENTMQNLKEEDHYYNLFLVLMFFIDY